MAPMESSKKRRMTTKESSKKRRTDNSMKKELTRTQTAVALRLTARVLLNEAAGKNAVISPLSIHMLLSMGSAAMSGPWQEGLLSFLNANSADNLHKLASDTLANLFVNNNPDADAAAPKLTANNGIWIDKSLTIKPKFKSVVDEAYKPVTEPVDFKTNPGQVARKVNEWAERNTNGLIKNAISPDGVDCETRAILANVIYFKAQWRKQFKRSWTRDEDFHRLDGSSLRVPFMRDRGSRRMSAHEGFKILTLDYKAGVDDGRRFTMYFLLPDARDGLPALVERACSEPGFLDRYKPPHEVDLRTLRIPKFKISLGLNALKLLEKMGLQLGCCTEMTEPSPEDDPLRVSNMIHKAVVEINEEETEAAAFTMMRVATGGCMVRKRERFEYVADHPFMFLIREEVTGTVLFTGQVLDPSQNGDMDNLL